MISLENRFTKSENDGSGGVLLTVLVISLIIGLIWFKDRLLFATAEEGAIFYSIKHTLGIYEYVWSRTGMGLVYSSGLAQTPLLFVLSLLEIFIENIIIQQILFVWLITSGIYGTFLFVKSLTDKKNAAMVAGLFYFFNLFVMSQVWNRSLFVGMFAWAYFPLYAYLLTKWIKRGNIVNIVLLLTSTLFYSWFFSNPGYIFSYVGFSTLYLGYVIYKNKTKSEIIKIFFRFVIFATLLLVINSWWIYPYISTLGSAYKDYSSPDLSYESLRGVSTTFPISEILLLRQKFFFNSYNNPQLPNLSWGVWYESVFSILLSILALSIMIWGWLKTRINHYWKLLSVMGLVGLFISKGVNPPLGSGFFRLLFDLVPFTSALRNPYEKFGVMWLLPYSAFFGLGYVAFYEKQKNFLGKIIMFMFGILILGVLVWPMWSGGVFEKYSWVKVPDYYGDLDEYLTQDNDDFRTLFLPMIPDHGAALSWGYRGVEPTDQILTNQMISKKIKESYYAGKYEELKDKIEKGENTEILFDELNIKYIVLRGDLRIDLVGAVEPRMLEKSLISNPNFKFVEKFGDLDLYMRTKGDYSFVSADGIETPDVQYTRVSPIKYLVEIKNATDGFSLVFKETFNDNWKLKIEGKEVEDHFVVYDYANAWEIDKTGDYSGEISFKIWPWE